MYGGNVAGNEPGVREESPSSSRPAGLSVPFGRRKGPVSDPRRNRFSPPREEIPVWKPTRDPRVWLMVFLLGTLAVGAFFPVLGNVWVNWDDPDAFLNNPAYRGLAWANLRWAWTTFLLDVYQPGGWMLWEVQYVACGLAPFGYHLVSLVLHALNCIVLYCLTLALLRRVSPEFPGRPSWSLLAGTAAAVTLFAVHPLRTEVVAWVSCQSYLSCYLLTVLSIFAYLRATDGAAAPRVRWLTSAVVLFAAALLCHPTSLCLPLLLLILDVYPLRRLSSQDGRCLPTLSRLLLEKLPFLAVAGLVCMVAFQARKSLVSVADDGLLPRLALVSQSICFYPMKTILPAGLCCLYTSSAVVNWLTGPHLASGFAVLSITVLAFLIRRRCPWLLAGWLAYLVLLAPNMGFARYGTYVVADRYAYLSTTAVVVLGAAGLVRLFQQAASWAPRVAGAVVVLAAVCVLAVLSMQQCRTWRNSETLWTHALAHGAGAEPRASLLLGLHYIEKERYADAERPLRRAVALGPDDVSFRCALASVLADQKKYQEGEFHARQALRLDPDSPRALGLLGSILVRQGQDGEGLPFLLRAVESLPGDTGVRCDLGYALIRVGRSTEAETHLTEAIRLSPTKAEAHNNLGYALTEQGKWGPAVVAFQTAVKLRPGYTEAYRNQGVAFLHLGRCTQAERCFARALQSDPTDVEAHSGLGRALVGQGKFQAAVAEFEQVVRAWPDNPQAHYDLGFTLARQNRLDEATAALTQALRLDPDHGKARQLLAILQSRQRLSRH
jgi:protein O-mannosyl-transferase